MALENATVLVAMATEWALVRLATDLPVRQEALVAPPPLRAGMGAGPQLVMGVVLAEVDVEVGVAGDQEVRPLVMPHINRCVCY